MTHTFLRKDPDVPVGREGPEARRSRRTTECRSSGRRRGRLGRPLCARNNHHLKVPPNQSQSIVDAPVSSERPTEGRLQRGVCSSYVFPVVSGSGRVRHQWTDRTGPDRDRDPSLLCEEREHNGDNLTYSFNPRGSHCVCFETIHLPIFPPCHSPTSIPFGSSRPKRLRQNASDKAVKHGGRERTERCRIRRQ